MPCFFACSSAACTLAELPLVVIPNAMSPGRPKAMI
jgi:hypothetical protein